MAGEAVMTDLLKQYDRAVIWGVHNGTHVHIHRGFLETLVRLGIPAIWVENHPGSNTWLQPRTLVIASWDSSHLEFRDDIDYCLHNWAFADPDLRFAPNVVYLQVFCDLVGDRFAHMGTDPATPQDLYIDTHYESLYSFTSNGVLDQWARVIYWHPDAHVLFQPWGTPLFPEDFGGPLWNPHLSEFAFVGSVWNNAENMGNFDEIDAMRAAAEGRGHAFNVYSGVSDLEAITLIRQAQFAPAIGGAWQARHTVLPCRGFKNVSYGALCWTNLPGFVRIFDGAVPYAESIDELVEQVLSLSREQTLGMIFEQQRIVAEQHTYVNRLDTICRAFEELR